MEHFGRGMNLKASSPSLGFLPPSTLFSPSPSLLSATRSSFTPVSAIDEEVRTFRRGGLESAAIKMNHGCDPLFKQVASSLRRRSGPHDATPKDIPSMSRRTALGSAFALVMGILTAEPQEAGAQMGQMSLEEVVKPPEVRKTISEPIDTSPLQNSYFQQFWHGITWKGQTIKYSAEDGQVASHSASERTMELNPQNVVKETAQFANKDVEIKKVVASGTSTKAGKTYLKPSGDMLCLSTDSLMEAKPQLHFEKVLVNPEDPKSRIVLTPVYESAESGNFQLKHIVFARESADGATTKLATEDTWGLPIGHDMGLPIKGRWTKTVETITADYMVQVMNTDYDRVAIPVHQDTYDRRVFALANEVIVALPTTIGAVSKGKTTHMDVLWTISDTAIVKGIFAFDKQGKFYQDVTERYARSG